MWYNENIKHLYIFIYGGVKLKKIPIGVEDFKEIIEKNYTYIDKTKFIEEFINEGAKVNLNFLREE